MAHGVVWHFDLPHMAQKVADWTRREGAKGRRNGTRCGMPFRAATRGRNNRRVTRVDSSLWPHRTVPKLPSGTNGCQTLETATLNASYFCQKRPLCQPPPSPTPPPNSHFVRKVKLRLAYRLAFVKNCTFQKTPVLMAPWVSPSYSSNFLVDSTLVFLGKKSVLRLKTSWNWDLDFGCVDFLQIIHQFTKLQKSDVVVKLWR